MCTRNERRVADGQADRRGLVARASTAISGRGTREVESRNRGRGPSGQNGEVNACAHRTAGLGAAGDAGDVSDARREASPRSSASSLHHQRSQRTSALQYVRWGLLLQALQPCKNYLVMARSKLLHASRDSILPIGLRTTLEQPSRRPTSTTICFVPAPRDRCQ